ncbi:NAD(P)-dependent alcohol dehydrogenase [Puniceicoccaceae bacterium K14]|nr:NAD(P)-dependent alcohol dehydrogenase [Puniceicoccaceae bacterium K14]
MKAISLQKYGSTQNLMLVDRDVPSPVDRQVLVKIHAASINDWEWAITQGSPFYIRLLCGLRKPKFAVLGVDISGTIEAVGPNCERFKEGDRVFGDLSDCGFGSFAEFASVSETHLSHLPENTSFEAGAALPHASLLALQAFKLFEGLQPQHKVLINGAGGGVGTIGIQVARSMGIQHVSGVDNASKLEGLKKLGFDEVIDYQTTDFTKTGETYDLIIDAKTNRLPHAYLRALNPNGHYVSIGGKARFLILTLIAGTVAKLGSQKKLQILGLKPNKGLEEVAALVESGKLAPVLDETYSLADTAKAISRFGSGKHLGKIIVTPS